MNQAEDVHWRSLLFVPADNARYLEKARTSRADAIVLDLEDAVLTKHKAEAGQECSHRLTRRPCAHQPALVIGRPRYRGRGL